MSTHTVVAPEGAAEVDYWEIDDSGDPPALPEQPLIDRLPDVRDEARSEARIMFDLLADELQSAMLGAGSTRRVARHPAYAEMIDLGEAAIPFLLERLRQPGARPLWLRLLSALTPYQPGVGQATVPDAAEEWIRWGKVRGYAARM